MFESRVELNSSKTIVKNNFWACHVAAPDCHDLADSIYQPEFGNRFLPFVRVVAGVAEVAVVVAAFVVVATTAAATKAFNLKFIVNLPKN